MNKDVQKIYDDAVDKSYYSKKNSAYWTGYFIGKVQMPVTDEDIDKYFEKVQIASQKLYDLRCQEMNMQMRKANKLNEEQFEIGLDGEMFDEDAYTHGGDNDFVGVAK